MWRVKAAHKINEGANQHNPAQTSQPGLYAKAIGRRQVDHVSIFSGRFVEIPVQSMWRSFDYRSERQDPWRGTAAFTEPSAIPRNLPARYHGVTQCSPRGDSRSRSFR